MRRERWEETEGLLPLAQYWLAGARDNSQHQPPPAVIPASVRPGSATYVMTIEYPNGEIRGQILPIRM